MDRTNASAADVLKSSLATNKTHGMTVTGRSRTHTLTEDALTLSVRQELAKIEAACRRCGAPSVETFDLVYDRMVAPISGPWSKAKLWDTMFSQSTCRRCGQICVPLRPVPTTPTSTPTQDLLAASPSQNGMVKNKSVS